MNLYQIIGDNEEETKKIIEELDLHNNLIIKSLVRGETYLEQVPLKIEYKSHTCNGDTCGPDPTLNVFIDNEKPFIQIKEGTNISMLDPINLASYVHRGVTVNIHRKEVDLQGILDYSEYAGLYNPQEPAEPTEE